MKGYVTYISAVLLVVYAVSAMLLGKIDSTEGIPMLIGALTVFGFRRALKNGR